MVEELDRDSRATSTEVGGTVKDGAVTLAGTFKTSSGKSAAEQTARKVKSVKVIAENIQVVMTLATIPSGEAAAERITGILQ